MLYTLDIAHALFPVAGFCLLIAGKVTRHKNLTIMALWLSLGGTVLHYQTSGGEILGSYFNYRHALTYSLNIVVLLFCIIDVAQRLGKTNYFRYLGSLIVAFAVTSVTLLLINLWVNARFIENKMPGTPILQVATFKKLDYCSYSYVFYKTDPDGKISYMCPNDYGLIPSVGHLKTVPEYVARQLPALLQSKFQKQGSN